MKLLILFYISFALIGCSSAIKYNNIDMASIENAICLQEKRIAELESWKSDVSKLVYDKSVVFKLEGIR
jgi:hypothetical protein